MLNKLISKFKNPAVDTQNSAEATAAETISTPEKTASLLARLEAESDLEPKYTPRYKLLRKQHEQASIAALRYQIEAERMRVARAVQQDRAAAEKALDLANDQHAIATDNLKTAQAKHQAIVARLEPLEAEQKNSQTKAQEQAAAAKSEFDAAIASGDATAEAIAAEKLFHAKTVDRNSATLTGPLALRIEALRNELITAADLVAVQENAIQQATKARLKAEAYLAMVEYDRQAQALLDAFVAQRVAVSACGGVSTPGGWVSDFDGPKVDQFDVQISSIERILFGSRIDTYNNRHLPSHVVTRIIEGMTVPNLSILTAKVEDLPNIPADPVEVEGHAFALDPADPVEVEGPAFVLDPDGSLKDLTAGYAPMK